MTFEAVIFDFDGVIARTMEDNCEAWRTAVAPWIGELADIEYLLLEGLSPRGVAEHLLAARSLDLAPVAEIVARKEAAYLSRNRFSLYPGIPELLEHLAGRCSLALVTGASRTRIERTLPIEILNRFQVVVTADDGTAPKPSPEPYLRAAAGLRLPPSRCLVAENAPLGIQSAKAAGMTCVAVASTLPAEYLAQADHIVPDSPALIAFLERAELRRPV